MQKVEPAKRFKHGTNGGIEFIPIDDKDYTFYFEVKKASELEQTEKPIIESTENLKEEILKQAKPYLPCNGIGFFVDGTSQNHRIIVDFDTSEIRYVLTSQSYPFYDNPHLTVKVTPEDLQKIYDFDGTIFMEDEEKEIHDSKNILIVMDDGEAAIYSYAQDSQDAISKLYDFIVGFTIIKN